MRKRRLWGVVLVVLLSANLLRIEATTITDAIHAVDPAIKITVIKDTSLFDNPQYCQSPKPLECFANQSFTAFAMVLGMDATGDLYYSDGSSIDFDGSNWGAYLSRRTRTGELKSLAQFYLVSNYSTGQVSHTNYSYSGNLGIDLVNGRFLVLVRAQTYDRLSEMIDHRLGLVEIAGLPTLFDTLLTFVPGGQNISVLTPTYPEGFRSADSLQVWTGDVHTLPDWTQSQPLACEAAVNPTPGQVVTVADTLADPPVGHGRYYLTASVNGPDRRLGRQYIDGTFSARNPAMLPVCQ